MENYKEEIKRTVDRYQPDKIGGCFMATRSLIRRNPELKEKIFKVKNISHCVAVTPEGNIIDTQWEQLNLIIGFNAEKGKYMFAKDEYNKLLGGDNYV